MTEENFYIGLKNPNSIRRRILESSKQVIEGFKSSYLISEIRERNINALKKLRQDISELIILINKLNSHLPEHSIRISDYVGPSNSTAKVSKPGNLETRKMPEKNLHASRLQQLEEALSSIESKLRKLQ